MTQCFPLICVLARNSWPESIKNTDAFWPLVFPLYAFWPEILDINRLNLTTLFSLICVLARKSWQKLPKMIDIKFPTFFPYMRLGSKKLTRIAIFWRNNDHHEIVQPVKSRINFEKDASPAFSVLRPPTQNLCIFYPFGHGIVTFWCEKWRERGLHISGGCRKDEKMTKFIKSDARGRGGLTWHFLIESVVNGWMTWWFWLILWCWSVNLCTLIIKTW